MKKFSFTVLLLFIATAVFSQERFEFKRIGFSIDTPKKWIAMKDDAIYENLNRYDFSEEQLAQLLKNDNASVNLCTYTKYDPKKVSGIIPTIKIRTKNTVIKGNKDFLEFVEMSNDPSKIPLDNFRFTDKPMLIKISNRETVKFSVRFTLKNNDKEYEIISRSYYILKEGYFISLNFIEEVGKEDNTALFETLVKSIQLAD